MLSESPELLVLLPGERHKVYSHSTTSVFMYSTPDFVCMRTVYTPSSHSQSCVRESGGSNNCRSDCFWIHAGKGCFWTTGADAGFGWNLVARLWSPVKIVWESDVACCGLGLTVCSWGAPMSLWGLRHVSAYDLVHWNTQKEKTDYLGEDIISRTGILFWLGKVLVGKISECFWKSSLMSTKAAFICSKISKSVTLWNSITVLTVS